jgi:hypothetical protein
MVERTRKKVDEGDYGDISLILKQPFPYLARNRDPGSPYWLVQIA